MDSSQIASYYRGRSIFITGATGFCGKVLVEKLLRSCPGVNKIYLLLRSKKGLDAAQRLEELVTAKLFDKIREEAPKQFHKLVAIHGDITLPGLGISDEDMAEVCANTSIVFHSAATVKFDEPLKTSVDFNLVGTRRLIELCHKMQRLSAVIHVSTAYANCNRNEVDEILYDSPVNPQKVIDMVTWMEEKTLDSITPSLLMDRPNTYTYTKGLAENLLVQECGDLPVAIVRPSIVTAAWREPVRGWIDNINGPTGLLLASGKGVLRTMYVQPQCVADLIPVDTVINLMITVAFKVGTTPVGVSRGIPVYNCTSGSLNPITWGDIERIAFPLLLRYPSSDVFRYPGGSFKSNRMVDNMAIMYEHKLPAMLVDGICLVTGKKRVMSRIYDKLHRAVNALEWFTTREWKFHCNNVVSLSDELEGPDKQTFHFDIRDLHWPTYWEDYVIGTRKFILKEENKTLPEARKNLKRLYYIHKFIQFMILYGLWNFIIMRSSFASRAWFTVTSFALRFYSTTVGSLLSGFSSPPGLGSSVTLAKDSVTRLLSRVGANVSNLAAGTVDSGGGGIATDALAQAAAAARLDPSTIIAN